MAPQTQDFLLVSNRQAEAPFRIARQQFLSQEPGGPCPPTDLQAMDRLRPYIAQNHQPHLRAGAKTQGVSISQVFARLDPNSGIG